MTKSYADIIRELKDRFPKGTVQQGRYIPNEVYVDQLETAAESSWHKEILQLNIRPENGYVSAIVRVRIAEHYRDGYSFVPVQSGGNATSLETAVNKAVNLAFIDAIHSWQVGWIDLARETNRDWKNSPGITLLQNAKDPEKPGTGDPHPPDIKRG